MQCIIIDKLCLEFQQKKTNSRHSTNNNPESDTTLLHVLLYRSVESALVYTACLVVTCMAACCMQLQQKLNPTVQCSSHLLIV